jgi:phosphohistidine phosphatase
MKILGLLRHAKSDWDDMALRDFDRGLNDRGRRGAALMGQHIMGQGIKWDAVLASPAQRVQRTLEASGIEGQVQWNHAAYLADAGTLIALLNGLQGDPRRLLLVGHNPGLQELILELVSSEEHGLLYDEVAAKYPTASFAVLELDIDDWADCAPGCGRIVHFARPRDLDPELGPEQVS